jgi:hypothetical protein
MLKWVQFALYTVAIQAGGFSAYSFLKDQLSFSHWFSCLFLMASLFGLAFWIGEYRIGGRSSGDWPPVGFRRTVIAKVLYVMSCYMAVLLASDLVAFNRIHVGRIAVLAAACIAAALVWGRGVAVFRQSLRDHLAGKILRNEEKGFVLLLRPFQTIGKLEARVHKPLSLDEVLDPVTSQPNRRGTDMETHICAALDGTAVLALGWNQPIVGAGKVQTSDENWFEVFVDLATRAGTILLLPLGGVGTTREVTWLMESRCISKVVFVCPQSNSQSAVAAGWEQTRKFLRSRGDIQLPPFTETGGLFRFATDSAKPVAHYFSSFSEEEFRRALHFVTGRIAPKHHQANASIN